jgi:hypothetical protein
MQVQVEVATEADVYEGLTAHVRGVVERALGRYAGRVTRVEVHLSDDDRHEGGREAKRCLMEARLEGRAPRVVAHRAASLHEVVEGAAGKLGRSLEHTLERTYSAGLT